MEESSSTLPLTSTLSKIQETRSHGDYQNMTSTKKSHMGEFFTEIPVVPQPAGTLTRRDPRLDI
jgi:hypothetical protein